MKLEGGRKERREEVQIEGEMDRKSNTEKKQIQILSFWEIKL